MPIPLSVPFVSIYSNNDYVVKSHTCIKKGISKANYQNIEVSGFHIGLPFNLKAYQIIASELSGLKPTYSKTAIAGGSSF